MIKPSLAQLLIESSRRAEQELAHKLQVERITEAVKAKLAHKRIHAEGEDDLICPSCGYKGPEEDFDTDDDAADGFRTDPVTSGTYNHDNQTVGEGAKVPRYYNRKL